jgi:tetratricopeptide (TPR) repeat protein
LRLLAKKDFNAALANFDRAIQLRPQMASAYHGRGTARMDSGDLDRAISDFTKALELSPESATSYFNRGLALVLQGKDTEAQKDFQRCLAIKPELKPDLDWRIARAKDLCLKKP